MKIKVKMNIKKKIPKENLVKKNIIEMFNIFTYPKKSFDKIKFLLIEKKLKNEKNKQNLKQKKEEINKEKRKELEERLIHKTIKKKIKKKKSAAQRKRFFEYLIDKAGLDIKIKDLRKKILFASFLFSGTESLLLMLKYISLHTAIVKVIADLFFLLTLGTALHFLVFLLIFFIYVDIKIYQRKKAVEEVLPEYLQLVAANIGAGMPIDQALWLAIRPQFGVLAKEMKLVAKMSLTGTPLDKALEEFSKKYDSPLLKRTIFLLIEGINAGGPIAKLLDRITVDIIDTKIMKKEMAANVMTYVIFISFASVLAAPFMFGLANQLIIIINNILGNLDLSSMSNSMFSITKDAVKQSDFKIFSITVLTITSIFSGMITSVIRNGNIKDGLKNIPALMIIALLIFILTAKMMSALLSGMF